MRFHNISGYRTFLLGELAQTERFERLPYLDSRGLATIGYGFNIEGVRDYLLLVLNEMGVVAGSDANEAARRVQLGLPSETAAQRNARIQALVNDFATDIAQSQNDTILRQRLDARAGTYGIATFELTSTQAENVYRTILSGTTIAGVTIQGKEERLDARISNAIPHETKEYVALMSMFYNSESTIPSNSALVRALADATRSEEDKRAEVWFQIRYNTNPIGRPDRAGMANRRYRESDLFGLYDDGPVSESGSKAAFRMYTARQGEIVPYELEFSPTNQFANSSSIDVQLSPGRTWLISNRGRGKTIDGEILVGDDNDNTDQLNSKYRLLGSTRNDLIFGEAGDDIAQGGDGGDVIYGGRGKDVLKGDLGDDILIGESGTDVLFGGAGDDRLEGGVDYDSYVVKQGEGTDTIRDQDGAGAVEFANNFLAGGTRVQGNPGQIYLSPDGRYRYTLLDGSLTAGGTLRVELAAGSLPTDGSVVIENFRNGDLHIALLESGDPTPPPGITPPPRLPDLSFLFSVFPNPSPIVLDLDGDGMDTVSVEDGVHFDHEGDGFRERTGWVTGDDGLLVWDRDGNGAIDSGRELFGSRTLLAAGSEAPNGFVALAELDANADGAVDGGDPDFVNLRIWRDLDGDGLAAPGELATLTASGVLSLSTAYTESTQTDPYGNEFRQVGTFTRSDSTTGSAIDIWFEADPADSVPINVVEIPDAIRALPDAKGTGKVPDLRQAVAQDASGALQALVASFGAATDPNVRAQLAEDIIYKWTGADTLAPHPVIGEDIKKYLAIELFTAQTIPQGGYATGTALDAYRSVFEVLKEGVHAQLMAQTHLKDLYALVSYATNPFTGRLQADLAAVESDLMGRILADPVSGQELLREFARSLVGFRSGAVFDLGQFYEFFRGQDEALGQIVIGAGRTGVTGTTGNDVLTTLIGAIQYPWQPTPTTVYASSPYLLDGGAGDDQISGGDGQDALFGGLGSDTLIGGIGDDILSGGSDNDFLYGKTGSDTYLFGPGFGQDFLTEDSETAGDVDRIVFQSGILPTDIGFSRWQANPAYLSATDLALEVSGGQGTLTLSRFYFDATLNGGELSNPEGYASGKRKIELISFADGTNWNLQDILGIARTWTGTAGADTHFGLDGSDQLDGAAGGDTIYAGAGDDLVLGGLDNDQLYGELGDDTLDGGAGDDVLQGGHGSDVFLFGRGSGQDTITGLEDAAEDFDIVRFAPDVLPADVVVLNDLASWFSFSIAGTADRLRLPDWGTKYFLEAAEFADGTVWDFETLRAKGNVATDGVNVLQGGENSDWFEALGGDDWVFGRAGDDYLDGGDGVDQLWGGDGADVLLGGAGNDWLDGEAGEDLLDDRLGNDNLRGGSGGDTYVFGRGYGADSIYDDDAGIAGEDTIRLLPDVLTSDVHVTRTYNSLRLRILDTGDTLDIANWFIFEGTPFETDRYRVERLEFGDGTVWDAQALAALSNTATEYDDYLVGTQNADSIAGLGGDDTIDGKAGDDTIDGGTGNDILQGDSGAPGADLLIGGQGDDVLAGGYGNDTLDGGAGSDTLLGGVYNANPIYFGTGWGGDVYVFGTGYGADVIYDYNTSTAPADRDAIRITPELAPSGVTIWRGGNDLYVGVAGTGDRLKVDRFFSSADYRVEQIEFNDGTIWDEAVLLAAPFGPIHGTSGPDVLVGSDGPEALYGYEGNDQLYGGGGDDTLDGGVGDDRLEGGLGNDTYLIAAGNGNDRISDRDLTAGNIDRVVIDGSIPSSSALLYRSSNSAVEDLYIAFSGSAELLTIEEYFDTLNGGYHVERVEFQDGTVWDETQLSAAPRYILGTSAPETLGGTQYSDLLEGKGGNDVLIGGAGPDTYYYAPGDGSDTIQDYDTALAADTIAFRPGISSSDVTLSRVWNDLILSLPAAGDQIKVQSWYLNQSYRVERMTFSDGTAADLAPLAANLPINLDDGNNIFGGTAGAESVRGLGGSDELILYGGDDTLDGGAGNDLLQGGAGNDTYIFALGYGVDTISDLDSTPGNLDTLRFSAGIAPADVVASRASGTNQLTLSVSGTADRVLINDWFLGAQYQIESIAFADGTVWDPAFVAGIVELHGTGGNDVLYGTTGSDRIRGFAGNDTIEAYAGADLLDGGTGNDTLEGGTGDDLYVYGPGDGADVVFDYDTTAGNVDELRFAAGIEPSQVSLVRAPGSSDLMLTLPGSDSVKIWSWFATPLSAYHIERIVFADGTVWDPATVDQLVEIWGTAGDDTIYGSAAGDRIRGFAGNDYLAGYLGNDTLFGGAGNDTYRVESGDVGDLIVELPGEGMDTVQYFGAVDYALPDHVENLTAFDGGGSNVRLTGNSLDNTIIGSGRAEILDGGPGTDRLEGGGGNDTYLIDSVADQIVELAGGGTDTVNVSFSYILPDQVEQLVLQGADSINATGNAAANTLVGNGGANVLDGGAGADQMSGGAGDDTYIVDDASDLVTETNAADGSDTVQSSVNYSMPLYVERLVLTGISNLQAFGGSSPDILIGNSGNNILVGNDGDDWLDGGAGADSLQGGAGNDTYVVDDTSDTVVESASQGSDLVESSVTYTLPSNVENLTLTGTANINGTGNSVANVLTGNDGVNALTGGAGNDSYYVGAGDTVVEGSNAGTDTVFAPVTWTLATNIENLTLTGTADINGTGNTANNTLTGNAGNNRLDGGSGSDTMRGGLGDDTYVVGVSTDVVIENAGEGTDTVESSVTYTLPNNVENLTLTGTANRNGTGNALDNRLIGNSGNNTLTGNAGSDYLDGGAGSDTMRGGLGDDTYVVERSTDSVTENAGEGADTVQSSISYTLGANVENLTLLGTTAINGTGNTLNNVLTGNSGNNTLSGAGGNDTLDGVAGADTLVGGTGNDTYLLGRGYGAETVQENDATAGNTDLGQFLAGVAPDQVWLQRSGNDLITSIIGTPDQFTVQNWYLGSQYRIEQFKTVDGNKTLLESQVQNLVDAMAAFAPPAPGQTTLPPDYAAALGPVIAANWQ